MVGTKTQELHSACEALGTNIWMKREIIVYIKSFLVIIVEEQAQLVKLADSIEKKLMYFNELPKLSQILNAPLISVHDETFTQTLTKLDECIAFVTSNVRQRIIWFEIISVSVIWYQF